MPSTTSSKRRPRGCSERGKSSKSPGSSAAKRLVSIVPRHSPVGSAHDDGSWRSRAASAARGSCAGSSGRPIRPGVTVIGNVGDDVEVLGVHVSPDLDSILYALAGARRRGARLGPAPTRPGSRSRRRSGSAARAGSCSATATSASISCGRRRSRRRAAVGGDGAARDARSASRRRCCPRPTTGCAPGSTRPAGSFPFQEWFVARRHRDEVDRVRFEGEDAATPAPGVVEAIEEAELIVICPSNPFISIWPILAVDEIRAALERRRVPSIAVSPLVGGRAIKGPADRDAASASPAAPIAGRVAACYPGAVDALVLDEADADGADGGRGRAACARVVTQTLMKDRGAAPCSPRPSSTVPELAGSLPVEGLPEIAEGDDLGGADRGARSSSSRRRRRRLAEGRVEGRGPGRPARRRRAVRPGARARRRSTTRASSR